MKTLLTATTIATALMFAPINVQTALAVDAHHPDKPATTSQKKPTPKTKAGGMMMNCPMMTGGMMQQGMMQGGMMQNRMMMGAMTGSGGMMNCPMMASAGQAMGMMAGMGPQMMDRKMRPGGPMMGQPDRCWTEADRDRGFGFWGGCKR